MTLDIRTHMQTCRVARKDRHDRHDWAFAFSEFRSLGYVSVISLRLLHEFNLITPGLTPAYPVGYLDLGPIIYPTAAGTHHQPITMQKVDCLQGPTECYL
jgi:hypothetical protein